MDRDQTGSLNKSEAKNFLEQAMMTLRNYSPDAPLDLDEVFEMFDTNKNSALEK